MPPPQLPGSERGIILQHYCFLVLYCNHAHLTLLLASTILSWLFTMSSFRQVLEEALLPFLANFPTNRLKLITMYIEQRRAREKLAAAAAAVDTGAVSMPGFARVESGGSGAMTAATATRYTPIR